MDQMMAAKPATELPLPYVLVDRQRLDLTACDSDRLKLCFGSSVWDSELFLVIDLYSAANPVHPAGHVGWWKWPLEIKSDLTVEVVRGELGFDVTFDGVAPEESWKNPDFPGIDEPVIALHVVLRPVISEAVRFDDILYVYNTPRALAESQARRSELDNPRSAVPSVPWYVWPGEARVHLVSTNVFERDAVGNFALSLHRLLRANGIPCQLYAGNFDPTLRETIRHTCELFDAAGEDDLLIVNFSIFEPWLSRLVELPSKKVLYFHNITPPRFLQVYDAEYAAHCADGIAQLKYLDRFDAFMANSTSSARVLQSLASPNRLEKSPPAPHFSASNGPFAEASRILEKVVVEFESQSERPLEVTASPPIIGAKDWSQVEAEPIDLPPQGTLLLYVGRIAPHKRVEDLFALFERYRALDPDSALLVVGGARFGGYAGFLRYLLNNEYADLKQHIFFHDGVSDGQLKTLYERGSAFVTMSEHEGFCVPVVEAMAFDKPVFAYADEAVLETLGRSGRVFYTKDFRTIAAEIHAALSTPWIRGLMIAAQRQRLTELCEQASGRSVWSVLEKVMYGARPV
jgi:glycosyltransferase involved in cell wall biosynthesis